MSDCPAAKPHTQRGGCSNNSSTIIVPNGTQTHTPDIHTHTLRGTPTLITYANLTIAQLATVPNNFNNNNNNC